GEIAGEPEPAGLRDGPVLADGGHHPLVAVTERRPRPAVDRGEDVASRRTAFLDGGRRQPRHQAISLLVAVSHVADDESVEVAGDREIRVYLHPARAVQLDAERA